MSTLLCHLYQDHIFVVMTTLFGTQVNRCNHHD